jgi:hypothetical protein
VTITQAGYHIKLPSPAEKAFFVQQWIGNCDRDFWLGTTKIEYSMKENINQVSMKWCFHYNQM